MRVDVKVLTCFQFHAVDLQPAKLNDVKKIIIYISSSIQVGWLKTCWGPAAYLPISLVEEFGNVKLARETKTPPRVLTLIRTLSGMNLFVFASPLRKVFGHNRKTMRRERALVLCAL